MGIQTGIPISMPFEMPRLSCNDRIRSLHNLITREIACRILRGNYAVGEILPGESELMAEFRASRTALREALKTLAAKGLVVAKTRVGTRVLPVSFWNYYDPQVLSWRLENGVDAEFLVKLFEVRQALEPAAAALAATQRKPEDLVRLRRYLREMNAPHRTATSYAEPDLGFHQQILLASHNPFLQTFSTIIEASIISAFGISAPIERPERHARSIQRHQMVYDAIQARDPAKASRAMSEVIAEGLENAHIDRAVEPIQIFLPLASSA